MARDRDDYDDDRPRRRDRDDDYDDRPPPPRGPLDNMFANTNIVVLVLFGICCGLIAFVLSLICVVTAKDPKAKSNAMVVLIISAVLSAVGTVLQFTGALAGLVGGR